MQRRLTRLEVEKTIATMTEATGLCYFRAVYPPHHVNPPVGLCWTSTRLSREVHAVYEPMTGAFRLVAIAADGSVEDTGTLEPCHQRELLRRAIEWCRGKRPTAFAPDPIWRPDDWCDQGEGRAPW